MINAGILDGDHVVIRRSTTKPTPARSSWLWSWSEEATLKRLQQEGASIALRGRPTPAYSRTRIFGPDQIEVHVASWWG